MTKNSGVNQHQPHAVEKTFRRGVRLRTSPVTGTFCSSGPNKPLFPGSLLRSVLRCSFQALLASKTTCICHSANLCQNPGVSSEDALNPATLSF